MSLRSVALPLIALLAVLLSGCDGGGIEVIRETDETAYQRAKNYQKQGRVEEALEAYLQVIEKRPGGAPESHFEAGHIFLQELGDPLRAIYHFDRFLELKSDSPHAERVRQLRKTAEKEFARSLPAQPFEGQLQREELLDMVGELTAENAQLRQQVVDLGARIDRYGGAPVAPPPQGAQSVASAPTPQPDPAATPESYVVQSGDTLMSISRTVYGTPSRWMEIFQANRDRLASQDALRIGQQLRIP